MSETPGTPANETESRSAWSRVRSVVAGLVSIVGGRELLAGVAALALLAIAAFGGLKDAAAEATDVVAAQPGQAVTVSPFEVSATQAVRFDELPGVLDRKQGVRYLGVALTVTNTGQRFVPAGVAGPLDAAFRIDAQHLLRLGQPVSSDQAAPQLFRVVDGRSPADLQPGLTYDLLAVWSQDANASPPATVTVSFSPSEFRVSSLDGSPGWFAQDAVATVTLPVTQGRS